MSHGGESGVHASSVVGPPLDRAFGLSYVVGEVRRRGLGGGIEICQPDNPRPDLHSAMLVAIGVMLDSVWGDESSRRADNDGWACLVPV